jgi:hypothetical protein
MKRAFKLFLSLGILLPRQHALLSLDKYSPKDNPKKFLLELTFFLWTSWVRARICLFEISKNIRGHLSGNHDPLIQKLKIAGTLHLRVSKEDMTGVAEHRCSSFQDLPTQVLDRLARNCRPLSTQFKKLCCEFGRRRMILFW